MRTRLFTLSALLFAGPIVAATAAEGPPPTANKADKPAARDQTARLVFNPGGGPWSGETPFQGASWSALGPGLEKNKMMRARAGIGDRFPVQERGGATLFEIILENGVDDHLEVVVTSAEGDQKARLPRDKRTVVTVAGTKYALLFPTSRVAAAEGERPSTNKATIFVTQLP